MSRRTLMAGLAAGGAGASLLKPFEQPAAAAAEPAPRRRPPNLVVFLIDDMGWQDTSVPFWTDRTPFNDHFRTPNMERLAAAGVRFRQAYCCPVCSPTRTSLMTGQNAARHGVTNWTLLPDRDQSGETERLRAPVDWRLRGLQPGDVTLPGCLREAGYRTIHVGKAHWGTVGTPGADPRNLGFEVNIAGHAAGGPGCYHGAKRFSAAWRGGGHQWDVPGLERYWDLPVHLTDALTIEALREVDAALEAGAPFYLYLSHYAVHAPIEVHGPYDRAYRERGVDAPESAYASLVEGMDASLGAVLRHLEARGIAEETLVVFASDNGGLSAHARGTTPRGTGPDTHCWPLKAGKGSAYEGGTRVPWIIGWAKPDPAVENQRRLPVEPGATRDEPVIVEDLFSTLLAWGGTGSPAGHVTDGRDLTPLLATNPAPGAERPLVFHYPHVWGPRGPGYEPHSSLRLGEWKVIYFYEPRRWELYHLPSDIGEEHDLARDDRDRAETLAERLIAELEARGARYPQAKAADRPEPPRWD